MGPVAPPSTVTEPAARFRPGRRADHLLLGSGRHRGRSVVQRPRAAELRRSSACGPARSGPRARPGTARAATWSGATSPTTGRCAGSRTTATCRVFRDAVEQQQRQHLRLPGPADLLRASDAARGPLRARRLGDRDRRIRSRASGSTRRTTPCRIPTAASGSPTRPTAASSTKARPTSPEARPTPRAGSTRRLGQPPASAPSGKRELPTQTYRLDPNGTLTVVATEEQVPDPNGLCFSPDYKTAVRRQHRQGTGRHRAGRQGQRSSSSTSTTTARPRTTGSSPTAWSMA